jgi:hypothetical protein
MTSSFPNHPLNLKGMSLLTSQTGSHYTDQGGVQMHDPPASASLGASVIGVQHCVYFTLSWCFPYFDSLLNLPYDYVFSPQLCNKNGSGFHITGLTDLIFAD